MSAPTREEMAAACERAACDLRELAEESRLPNHSADAFLCEAAAAELRRHPLDEAWVEINAIRHHSPESTGLFVALSIIERLGGMDPAKRGKA